MVGLKESWFSGGRESRLTEVSRDQARRVVTHDLYALLPVAVMGRSSPGGAQ